MRDDAPRVLESLYESLAPRSVGLIREGRDDEALRNYRDHVLRLAAR